MGHQRTVVKVAVEGFADSLGRSTVVVTCRSYAYRVANATWLLPQNAFPVVTLSGFDDDQIGVFLKAWYGVEGRRKGWDKQRIAEASAGLSRTVLDRPHLRSLAGSPLLLTLMAQMHSRDGQLPDDRADLYDRAVKLILAQWERRIERDLQGGLRESRGILPQLGLKMEDVRRALARVAFVVHEHNEGVANREDIIAEFARKELLDALEIEGLEKANELIEYVTYRAGLLVHQGGRTYAFPHRTFQEYLAAEHLCRSIDFQEDYPEQLSKRVWRDLELTVRPFFG